MSRFRPDSLHGTQKPSRRSRCLLVAGSLIVTQALSGCGDGNPPSGVDRPGEKARGEAVAEVSTRTGGQNAGAATVRWYATANVERGAALFAANCASCHGDHGQGTFSWRKRGADGKFPPPPLDGKAHTWHHPLRALATQIKLGTPGGQGAMPGFAGKLSDEQVLDVIAWIQARWPDKIYAQWLDIEARSRASSE